MSGQWQIKYETFVSNGYTFINCNKEADARMVADALNGFTCVGETMAMPGGSTGFTMACFNAEAVPVGTRLYASMPSAQPITEEVPLFAPDVDQLSHFIRAIDGRHSMGAGALAERICEWLSEQARAGLNGGV